MNTSLPNQNDFLTKFNIPTQGFAATELNWTRLEEIYADHSKNIPNLEATAKYIIERLYQSTGIHSLKFRVKDAEHLIEKIIRKKIQDSEFDVSVDDYTEKVTDLIGVRILHLFKDEWIKIHKFITDTWEIHGNPTANIREGDSEEMIKLFKDNGCEVKKHPFGYRSVHYLAESKPSKNLHMAELQVRTIFEEGWSEIDHRIRYPYDINNPILGQFLVIFNRLAGSADEMGSFIKFLKTQLDEKETHYAESKNDYERTIVELKDEIEKLKISPAEKSQVQSGIDKLSKISLHQRDPEAFQLVLNHTVKAAMASINIQTLLPMIQKNLVPALAATGVKVAEAEDRKAAVDKNDAPNESKK